MATDIVGSLFGMTPEQLQIARDNQLREQALAYTKLTPEQKVSYGAALGGQQLGNALGGLMGAEDPMLSLVKRRQELQQGLDFSSPESLLSTAQKALQGGDAPLASALSARAFELRDKMQSRLTPEQKNAIALAQSKGFAPGSDAFNNAYTKELERLTTKRTTNIANDIQVADEIGRLETEFASIADKASPEAKSIQSRIKFLSKQKDKLSTFGQSLVDAGLEPGTPAFQRRMNDYVDASIKGKAKGQGVDLGGIFVDTGAAGKEAGKTIGGRLADIENQYSILQGLNKSIDLVNEGIYAGAYGPELGALAKYSGGAVGSREKVIRTEQFLAYIGDTVIPRLKEFGGNDSNEELKYLTRVQAGDQRLEPESMIKILKSAENKIRRNIARLQSQAKSASEGKELPLGPTNLEPTQPQPQQQPQPTTGKTVKWNDM